MNFYYYNKTVSTTAMRYQHALSDRARSGSACISRCFRGARLQTLAALVGVEPAVGVALQPGGGPRQVNQQAIQNVARKGVRRCLLSARAALACQRARAPYLVRLPAHQINRQAGEHAINQHGQANEGKHVVNRRALAHQRQATQRHQSQARRTGQHGAKQLACAL